ETPLHPLLAGGDLARVDVAGDEGDGLAVAHERVDLRVRQPARIGQLRGGVADALEVPHVRLGRHDGHDEVLAERRLAERRDLHARRRGGDGAEVGDDLPVVGELAVGADIEAYELRRARAWE